MTTTSLPTRTAAVAPVDTIRKAPREFVETPVYAGPDRRRRELSGQPRRRASDAAG